MFFVSGYQAEEVEVTDGEEGVQASRELVLPSRELHGVWENLIFDEGIKEKLLRYVNTGRNSRPCLSRIAKRLQTFSQKD